MRPAGDGKVEPTRYTVIGQTSTFRVNADNTTTPIEQITARSDLYDVTFTFNVTQATYQADGAPALAEQRTEQVNALVAHDHVIAARGEQDQGADGNLYNYLVVTVGTDDGARSSDVRLRMDQLGVPSAFAAIDNAWKLLTNLGAVA